MEINVWRRFFGVCVIPIYNFGSPDLLTDLRAAACDSWVLFHHPDYNYLSGLGDALRPAPVPSCPLAPGPVPSRAAPCRSLIRRCCCCRPAIHLLCSLSGRILGCYRFWFRFGVLCTSDPPPLCCVLCCVFCCVRVFRYTVSVHSGDTQSHSFLFSTGVSASFRIT